MNLVILIPVMSGILAAVFRNDFTFWFFKINVILMMLVLGGALVIKQVRRIKEKKSFLKIVVTLIPTLVALVAIGTFLYFFLHGVK